MITIIVYIYTYTIYIYYIYMLYTLQINIIDVYHNIFIYYIMYTIYYTTNQYNVYTIYYILHYILYNVTIWCVSPRNLHLRASSLRAPRSTSPSFVPMAPSRCFGWTHHAAATGAEPQKAVEFNGITVDYRGLWDDISGYKWNIGGI